MGRGWLKETVKEINTALVFVEPVTLHEESQEVRMTIHSIEYPISGPGTPEKKVGYVNQRTHDHSRCCVPCLVFLVCNAPSYMRTQRRGPRPSGPGIIPHPCLLFSSRIHSRTPVWDGYIHRASDLSLILYSTYRRTILGCEVRCISRSRIKT